MASDHAFKGIPAGSLRVSEQTQVSFRPPEHGASFSSVIGHKVRHRNLKNQFPTIDKLQL
jgi:hypothetical protein